MLPNVEDINMLFSPLLLRWRRHSKLEKVRRSSLERATNSSSLKTWARDQKHPVSGQNRRFTAKLYARSGLGGLLYLTLSNRSSKNPEVQIRPAVTAKSLECATIHIHTGHCHIETCPVIYLLFQLYGSTVPNRSSVANMELLQDIWNAVPVMFIPVTVIMLTHEWEWFLSIGSFRISTPYLPCRQQVATSNMGPILVFPRIQPFGSDKSSSLGKVYSRQATESLNCENSSVSSVMKHCPTSTVVKNPVSAQNLLTLSCCDNFSIRSPYLSKRSSSYAGSLVKGMCVFISLGTNNGLDCPFTTGRHRSDMASFTFFTHFWDCSVNTELMNRNNCGKNSFNRLHRQRSVLTIFHHHCSWALLLKMDRNTAFFKNYHHSLCNFSFLIQVRRNGHCPGENLFA